MGAYNVIGTDVIRNDVLEKVTGEAKYGADCNQIGQLYAYLVTSPHPYAKIIAIDISAAEKVPGVEVVLTGKDNPGYYGQFINDQPVFACEYVRYEGEPIAAVAARTEEIAREACLLIKVDYEILTPILDMDEAVKETAPILHDWKVYEMVPAARPIPSSNICDTFKLIHGDVEKGFEEADIVLEAEYNTGCIQHSTIEPHVSIAKYDSSGFTIWSPTQSPFLIQKQLCHLFDKNNNQVRIICTHIGGGFGAKYELRCEPIVACLAMKTNGRPVKLTLTRKQEFYLGGVRGPARVKIKTGAKKDGTLVAYQLESIYDTGAYSTTGPRITYNSMLAAAGAYKCENIKIDSFTVVTNKHLTCPYRGFGVPEISWAYESHMNEMAKKLSMDPYHFRLKNILVDGDKAATGEILFSCGVKQCIEQVADMLHWGNGDFISGLTPEGKYRGRGIAMTSKVTGTPSSGSAIIKLNEDGTVTVLQSSLEMGQGSNTTLAMIVSESLGLPLENIYFVPVDTIYTPYEKTTTGSRTTFHVGVSLLRACDDLKKQVCELTANKWGITHDRVTFEDGAIRGVFPDRSIKSYRLEDVKKTKILHENEPVNGRGSYSTIGIFDPPDPDTHQSKRSVIYWFWSAHGCEVEIDPRTGKITILKYVASHDVGKVINPIGATAQVEGGIVMGIGSTLLEEMIYDEKGILKNPNMVDFKVPTAQDITFPMEIRFVEHAHPEGPYGAKGLGEPPMTPVACSIGNAIEDATGIRIKTLPIKQDDMLNALKAAGLSSSTVEVKPC